MRVFATIIICAVICFAHGPAFCEDARLTDIIVTNTRDDLLLFLNVQGAFRERMDKAVLSGVPVTFSFFVNLYKIKKWAVDEKIASLKLVHTLKYDSLKKVFTIFRPWQSETPVTTQTLAEAKKFMTEINSLKVIPLNKLEKKQPYQIRAKAELSKVTLPFYLHYALFFVSFWDFETDWYTIDFVY